MKAKFSFDYNLTDNVNTCIDLEIIPRIHEYVDLDVFLSEKQIEELESIGYDDNSGADYAIVIDVTLRKDKDGLYYAIYLTAESGVV